MLKLFKTLFLLSLIPTAAQAGSKFLNLENAPTGEARIKLNHNDFNIKIESKDGYTVKSIFDKTSFEWVRTQNVLLVPRARLKLKVQGPTKDLYIQYKDKIISFQQSKKSSFGELYVSLFEKLPIRIFNSEKEIANIQVTPKDISEPKMIIDYTCSRNGIEIEGMGNEHLSLGCHTRRIGEYGKEKPMLEITWLSPELKIKGADFIPYQAAFLNKRPVKIKVVNTKTGKEKEITIRARIPKRLHRLFTAYGFGPYAFDTKTEDKNGKKLRKNEPAVPALFFYINYKISDTSSIRGFDAAVFKESRFNNAGIYLGNDFGFSLDNKLYFTTLLGVQYLYFKFDPENPEVSEPIFPQGIEFMYRHAFDIPNYIISGGVFLSPSESIDYQNFWVRWGKNYFWELNLISWGQDQFKATMWGLSVGFPFKGFL